MVLTAAFCAPSVDSGCRPPAGSGRSGARLRPPRGPGAGLGCGLLGALRAPLPVRTPALDAAGAWAAAGGHAGRGGGGGGRPGKVHFLGARAALAPLRPARASPLPAAQPRACGPGPAPPPLAGGPGASSGLRAPLLAAPGRALGAVQGERIMAIEGKWRPSAVGAEGGGRPGSWSSGVPEAAAPMGLGAAVQARGSRTASRGWWAERRRQTPYLASVVGLGPRPGARSRAAPADRYGAAGAAACARRRRVGGSGGGGGSGAALQTRRDGLEEPGSAGCTPPSIGPAQ